MLKIKQKNCRFKVDEKNRTVVCWIEGPQIIYAVENFMREQGFSLSVMMGSVEMCNRLCEIAKMPRRINAVAVCAPGDTWNEDMGKLIAYSKMKTKFATLFFKHFDAAMYYINNQLQNAANAADAIYSRMETELGRLEHAVNSELDRLGN